MRVTDGETDKQTVRITTTKTTLAQLCSRGKNELQQELVMG